MPRRVEYFDHNVQEGIIRAQHRELLRQPMPITPDEVYAYRIELGTTVYLFRAGHRLRVQVSSSDFPRWDRNLNTGGQPGTEGAAHARWPPRLCSTKGATLPVPCCRSWSTERCASRSAGALRVPAARHDVAPLSVPCIRVRNHSCEAYSRSHEL